jgi:predicted ATPase
MIKELAPLSLYLKYVANLNDLVIIDEPEMNLHPAAQAEMTEFMGMLVNSGLNLLITTHSPYIIAHLENLMRAWDNEKKEKIKKHFYLEREEAFISKDEVSVYFFDDGKTQDVLSNTGQIEWDTFSDVSSDIAQIYSKIG